MTNSRILIAIFLAGSGSFIAGCEGGRSPKPTSSDHSTSRTRESPVDASRSRVPIGADVVDLPFASELLEADDPVAAGWPSEAVSLRIEQQLDDLGRIIVHSGKADDGIAALSRAPWAHSSKQFPRLRPDGISTVYEDAELTVLRSDESVRQTETYSLLESVESLFIQRKAQNVRTKFKVFGVQVDGNIATTDVHFACFISGQSQRVQIRSTWRAEWSDFDKSSPRLRRLVVQDYEEAIARSTQTLFSDCTEAVVDRSVFDQQFRMGIDFWLDRIESRQGISIGGRQGLAIGDVNGDLLDDVYVCAPGGLPNRLFVQQADGTTRERSAQAGVNWLDSSYAALLVDLDNDGDQDLVVGVDAGVIVSSNHGHGVFQVQAALVLPAALPYSLSAVDFDSDGDLDIYACCYNRRYGVNPDLLFPRPVPYHDAQNGGRNVLLENVSTVASKPWRFRYSTGRTGLDQNNRRFSYAAAWDDYDNDGDVDLYVANDFGRNNLYRNDNGRFDDVAPEAGVEDIGAGMSACWGDLDNDGRLDLYVGNMFSSAGNRISSQSRFHQTTDGGTRQAYRRHARGNSLFHNLGDGTFRDISVESGTSLGRWAWGSKVVDVNNDGLQDIVVANGFITQEDTGDL